MRDVILVLGMHRSGTSSVAGVATLLGAASPKHLIAPNVSNERGYFESAVLCRFHDELLDAAGSAWCDWRPFRSEWNASPGGQHFRKRAAELFVEEFGDAHLSVFKDPRVCRFVSFWLDVLDGLETATHVVMPIRSPVDVALSLCQREQGLSLNHALLLWMRHVLDAERHSRNVLRSIFSWRDFCADWRRVCIKIAYQAGIEWPRFEDVARQVDHFLTSELVHHATGDGDSLKGHIPEWVWDVYATLLVLAEDPNNGSALSRLDRIRMDFDEFAKDFGPSWP